MFQQIPKSRNSGVRSLAKCGRPVLLWQLTTEVNNRRRTLGAFAELPATAIFDIEIRRSLSQDGAIRLTSDQSSRVFSGMTKGLIFEHSSIASDSRSPGGKQCQFCTQPAWLRAITNAGRCQKRFRSLPIYWRWRSSSKKRARPPSSIRIPTGA
jgi:hypothetical protein